MAKDKFLVLRGALHWAKLTGKARPYTGNPKFNKGPYWSVDLTPDAKSLAALEAEGLSEKLKSPKSDDKSGRTGKFIKLTVLENRSDGSKNEPPRIIDASGQAWDGSLMGNGTVGDIKVKVKDYDGMKGVYFQALRVLDHVPYESQDFEPLSADDEYSAPAMAPADASFDEDLNDDVPF